MFTTTSKITGIEHIDGRSIHLGGVVIKKFNGADGVIRLTWGRVVELRQHDKYLTAKVEYFKNGIHSYNDMWDDKHMGQLSCRDGGIQDSHWIAKDHDTREPVIRFMDGNPYVADVLIGKWASPQAIEFSALHGGPTGLGRCEGWSTIQQPSKPTSEPSACDEESQ